MASVKSSGCLTLHLREHQGCQRCAQVFGDEDVVVSRIVFHMKDARRASIWSSMSGEIGVRCCRSGRTCARIGIGDGRRRYPLNARPNPFYCALPG
jgi:hypothetical protein